MQLSPESREDLSWWVRTLPHAYKQIDLSNPDIEVPTDASKQGWGAVCLGETTQGLWSESEKMTHINKLEILAVHFALRCFNSHIKGKHVKINSDNSTAVCYLNAMGGTKSPSCNKLVQGIWTWCMQNKVWLTASHLPGALNVEAGQQSRQFNERTEWHLREMSSKKFPNSGGTPDIDLFASRLNSQLPKYVSWKPDPGATHVDAFSFTWTGMFSYLFPPFCLIARCLKKLESDRALALMVVPLWPTQAWWPQPSHSNSGYSTSAQGLTDTSSQRDGTPPKDQPKDGGMSVIREFYQTQGISQSATNLLLASWRRAPKNSTMCTSKNGPSFVLKGKLINFCHLL